MRIVNELEQLPILIQSLIKRQIQLLKHMWQQIVFMLPDGVQTSLLELLDKR